MPTTLATWVLVLWLQMDRGGAMTNVPNFPSKEICEQAGKEYLEARRTGEVQTNPFGKEFDNRNRFSGNFVCLRNQ